MNSSELNESLKWLTLNFESPNPFLGLDFTLDPHSDFSFEKNDYTDIDGILHEESICKDAKDSINKSEQNRQVVLYNPAIQANYTEQTESNSVETGVSKMTQPLRLSLKHVADLVPEFDGKNMTINEYVEKLKHAKTIVAELDEPNSVSILKIKLRGEVYRALENVKIKKNRWLYQSD